jgi:ADP-heptose:LPS heptosyltransferase
MRNDHYTVLSDWRDILSQPDLQFINLQYGEPEDELLEMELALGIQILRWPDIDLKNDLESVLALCSCLDSVISVGTAVSSLAPAVGTPTLLLTKQNWIMLGEDRFYPWHQNVKPLVASKGELVASKLKEVLQHIKPVQTPDSCAS